MARPTDRAAMNTGVRSSRAPANMAASGAAASRQLSRQQPPRQSTWSHVTRDKRNVPKLDE
eukprot:7071550-Prymnesium_polylepis.2